jgi:hypothetical protein
VEEVDTGVDPVSNEFDGFLDESINDCRVGLGDYHTVVGWFGHFGYLLLASPFSVVECTHHDGSLTTVSHVEITACQLSSLIRQIKLTGTPRMGRYK